MPTIQLNGNAISYGDQGSGPAVVLIPGWNEDHRMYKHVVPLLARRYRVLSLDWRGHGEDRTHNGDFTIDDMASDIVAFVNHLDLKEVFTVSSSHGGWANIEACQRLGATRVPKIVLVSWLLTEPSQGIVNMCQQLQEPEGWEAARDGFFKVALGDSDNQDIKHHFKNEMMTFGQPYWSRTGREMGSSYKAWKSVGDRLAALDEPRPIAHLYSLPHDPAYVRANHAFAESHPWFVPVRVPAETHFPVLESPTVVSRIIHEFLSDSDLLGR
jgi:pimeloyl-ACP methyl ester carboxylesterase